MAQRECDYCHETAVRKITANEPYYIEEFCCQWCADFAQKKAINAGFTNVVIQEYGNQRYCYYCGKPASQIIGDDWVCETNDCVANADNALRIQRES